jgi:predicted ATP-dependent endonuclease of OLD family
MKETPAYIRVKTEDFRAIKEADIIIDGITVVAGENGCGKSSLSKLLYFLYKTVANYDVLVRTQLGDELQKISKLLDIIRQELRLIQQLNLGRETSEFKKQLLANTDSLEENLNKWIKLINNVELIVGKNEISKNYPLRISRLKYIIKDILQRENISEDIKDIFPLLKTFIEERFKEASDKVQTRPTSLFIEALKAAFSDGILPKKFEVLEYDDLIVSLSRSQLSIPYNIQNAIYIDTPMMLSVQDSQHVYWNDLNELLRKKSLTTNRVSKLISSEIIQGDAVLDETHYASDEFKFKRTDGRLFNLLDVATGIKAFSILQILLKNGSLTDKTLLIIDEPESHLHPQWIIEYARIIVMLNKEIGVKFFIASHNPDMVSAIRYISEKENTLDKVNFYLAEKSDLPFQYNYTFLDKEIDPIFESFNIAIERINKYGI